MFNLMVEHPRTVRMPPFLCTRAYVCACKHVHTAALRFKCKAVAFYSSGQMTQARKALDSVLALTKSLPALVV